MTNDTKRIPLTKGLFALVDASDAPRLVKHKWLSLICPSGHRYAARTVYADGKAMWVLMHRLLLDVPPGVQVDHANGDGLDNRRENIRPCTPSENMCNRVVTGGTSKFKGVSWHANRRKWIAQIKKDRRHYFLGRFETEQEAAAAYDAAAKELHGPFARTNGY